MGLQYRCFLDEAQYEEPINVSDVGISIIRDDDTHGIGAEVSNTTFNFIGDGAAYIKSVRDSQGMKSTISLLIEQNCSDDDGSWHTLIDGTLMMSSYKRTCGNSCIVSAAVESSKCETVLKNRYNQSVDMDKLVSFDGLTPIPKYDKMGIDITLPTKDLPYQTYGIVADEGYDQPVEFGPSTGGGEVIWLRPEYGKEISKNIMNSNLSGATNVGYEDDNIFLPASAQVLWDEPNISCFSGRSFKVTGRLKGTITFPGTPVDTLLMRFERGEPDSSGSSSTPGAPYYLIQFITIATGLTSPNNYPFDVSINEYDWFPKDSGTDGLYLYLSAGILAGHAVNGTIHWDPETFFKAESVKSCPPSNTKAYLVHEALSHAVEYATDYCVRVKSEYYGRTDSQPFSFPSDGCGGLRFLTSGLKIRNADNPTFFASPQDLIEGLQAIDNIGTCIEDDPDLPGYKVLRVEALDYFYRDQEIMRCPAIAEGTEQTDTTKSYSKIDVGYQKWETQANFGNDELNSSREYGTSLKAINNVLTILSAFVAGEYALEITRQQQYVDTSDADTTYDSETFIVCLVRNGSNLEVEIGNVVSPSNIFSPGSIVNYRITPVRNLMRWFRSIAAGYPNIVDSDNRLFFNSGTGNIIASGELSPLYGNVNCRLEKDVLAENQDILPLIFADQTEATPLWTDATFSFDYPMSVKEYNAVKANPYGYISYQCGNGEWEKGWIKEVDFNHGEGMASFTLKKKW